MHRKTCYFVGIIAIIMGSVLLPPSFSASAKGIVSQNMDLERKSPINTAAKINLPCIYETNLTEKYRDLNPELTRLSSKLQAEYSQKTLLDNRDSSIFATWLVVDALMAVNATAVMETQTRAGIIEYLMGRLNGSMIFHENLNYSRFMNCSENSENKFLGAPYTPAVIHQTAIITLGKIHALGQKFSTIQLLKWRSAILASIHPDGGFGTRIQDGQVISSIVETYFAVACIQQLNLVLNEPVAAVYYAEIQNFVKAHQSANSDFPNPPLGCFYDSFTSTSRGWTNFQVDWLACQIIELIGAEPTIFAADFLTFLTTWDICMPEAGCFAPTFNESFVTDVDFYIGTVLIGDCVRILRLESRFPMATLQAKLTNQFGKYPYFRGLNTTTANDLSIQFFSARYFNATQLLFAISPAVRTNLTFYLADFFHENGGASFQTNRNLGLDLKCSIANYLNEYGGLSSESKLTLFWDILSYRANKSTDSLYYFTDYHQNNGTCRQPLFMPYDLGLYTNLKSTYTVFSTLSQLRVLHWFYNTLGWQTYLKFEAWPKSQLLFEGSFCNDSRFGCGDLAATYYALETQRILIEFNTGQKFSTYYSAQDFSTIRAYVMGYVRSNSTHWWAQAPFLSVNEATLYAASILRIVSPYSIDETKVINGIENQITHPLGWDLALLRFAQLYQTPLLQTNLTIQPSHATIEAELIRLNSASILRGSHQIVCILSFAWLAHFLPFKNIYIDRPMVHGLSTACSYQVAVCNWMTILPITAIEFSGEYGQISRNWSIAKGIYWALIEPEYSPTNIHNWTWILTFKYQSQEYCIDGLTYIAHQFLLSATVTTSQIMIRINCSAPILKMITVNATIKISNVSYEVSPDLIYEEGILVISVTIPVSRIPSSKGIVSVWIGQIPYLYWNNTYGTQVIEYRVEVSLPSHMDEGISNSQDNSTSNPSTAPGLQSNYEILIAIIGGIFSGGGVLWGFLKRKMKITRKLPKNHNSY